MLTTQNGCPGSRRTWPLSGQRRALGTDRHFSLNCAPSAIWILKCPSRVPVGKEIIISVQITNAGDVVGDEVVQLYVTHQGIDGRSPLRALKKFSRINLKAGESKTLDFVLDPDDLSLIDATGKSYQPTGIVSISLGGGQPGYSYASGEVVSKLVRIIK